MTSGVYHTLTFGRARQSQNVSNITNRNTYNTYNTYNQPTREIITERVREVPGPIRTQRIYVDNRTGSTITTTPPASGIQPDTPEYIARQQEIQSNADAEAEHQLQQQLDEQQARNERRQLTPVVRYARADPDDPATTRSSVTGQTLVKEYSPRSGWYWNTPKETRPPYDEPVPPYVPDCQPSPGRICEITEAQAIAWGLYPDHQRPSRGGGGGRLVLR